MELNRIQWALIEHLVNLLDRWIDKDSHSHRNTLSNCRDPPSYLRLDVPFALWIEIQSDRIDP
jgi:hypothetical protein